MTDTFDPAPFVQRQLDAYNARDLERCMVFGNKVIDHEMDVAAIYEVAPAGISRAWFVSGD
jgi:hypothetical protein